jgi:signal transduction histidine kinase
MREAVEHIEREIENLRSIITELRPAALDELGLKTALEALLDRHREQNGTEVDSQLELPDMADTELESTVYRLVQEALTNVAKHARADSVRVAIGRSDEEVSIEVQDDGSGFDPATKTAGFGLAGMRERVGLAGGTLEISSGEQGTLVQVCLPVAASNGAVRSGSQQAAS